MLSLLPDIVDQSANRSPDAPAFRCDGQAVRYDQLAEQSDSLASVLIEEGVRRGDRVGILMPPCVETAVSVYGVMKAGGVYVPIDPHTPLTVIRKLLKDCGIRHLICRYASQERLRQIFEQNPGVEVMIGSDAVDGGHSVVDWGSAIRSLAVLQRPRLLEDDLAYIMYSSGSTGRPKGIMHTHRSGMAYARLAAETYDVRPGDVIGNHSPLHFDMSTFGYFAGPLAGATTSIVPEAYTRVPASLSQLMESERISIWYSVPGALIHLMARGVLEKRNLSALRWVLYGGEPFPATRLQTLMQYWPNARFSNVYGPAEVNQCTFFHLPEAFSNASVDANTRIPIGRVWQNTEALVVDDHDRPVSCGEQGELLIRSSTMMDGYWNRPDLNARSFYLQVTDGGFQRVFYRTGDLVLRGDDDTFLFLGRLDRQIKTRGHRVELDDVEACFAAHESTLEAAAFPVMQRDGQRMIGVTVTLQIGETETETSLLQYARNQLPAYAVPSQIDIRDHLPRTATGKIDRNALQQSAEAAIQRDEVTA